MKLAIASAVALALAASTAAAQQGALECRGTEPFWGVTVTAKAMWFTDQDAKKVALVPVQPSNAIARPQDLIRVYRTRRADGRGAVTLVVTRNEQTCSDGMSDRRYAYNAIYMGSEGVMEGCCSWTR